MRTLFTAVALATALAMPTLPAMAGQSSIQIAPQGDVLLDQYIAYIGDFDLMNSNGKRLTQPWAIIRQDRANYHRFHQRDGALDEGDSFFGSTANRETMERLLRNGSISP